MNWTLKDLEYWNLRIEEMALKLGLDFFPQEFEICDYHDMIGYQSYVGMPSRYPHWSFGKSFEKQQMLYKMGVSGLAYEMVINSNPCLAYLMIDNPLSMQIMTMAHVYGHNDFFKNNSQFAHTRPEFAVERFKLHADRVRAYVETPGIGYDRVERILDAAHAIAFHMPRNPHIRRVSVEEQRQEFVRQLKREPDRWDHLAPTQPEEDGQYEFTPEPDEDLLGFIAAHNIYLEDWEVDLLNIVRDETAYFMPQMETKIMNEGWASFWHYTIMNRLQLPADLHMDFLRSHNQVIRPHVGGLNPYHVGYVIFSRLAGSDGHRIDYDINPRIFDVRCIDRDSSFLRRFLTEELMQELNLFEYRQKGPRITVSEVSDDEGWQQVRDTLIRNTGMNGIPVIKAKDVNPKSSALELVHEYDGRELELTYVKKTMEHVCTLWHGRAVTLETFIDNRHVRCLYKDGNFSVDEQ